MRSRVTVLTVLLGASALMAAPVGATPDPDSPSPGRSSAGAGASGAAPAVTPARLDFGMQLVGTESTTLEVVYANGTGSPQTVSATLGGPAATDYAISDGTCAAGPVADGASCTIGLVFRPSTEYTRPAVLHVLDAVPTTGDVALTGTGILRASSVAWGSGRGVGPTGASTNGTALAWARLASGSTLHDVVHAVVERADTTTGLSYWRSIDGGDWTVGIRIDPPARRGSQGVVAASGGVVYVAWTSSASTDPASTAPRTIWFRWNNGNGAPSRWSTPIRLTPATGRVDRPRIAAYGSNVYVAYTDMVTGWIQVRISRDYGRHWVTRAVGRTTRTGPGGRAGAPAVAASRTNVAVSWISTDAGAIRMRWSSDRGYSWYAANAVGTGAVSGSSASIAMVAERIVIGWTTPTGYAVRIRDFRWGYRPWPGTVYWHQTAIIGPSADAERTYERVGLGQVAANGWGRTAVAFEACWAGCGPSDPPSSYRADILWRESWDNGGRWSRSQVVIPDPAAAGGHASASLPSALWPTSTSRYLLATRRGAAEAPDDVWMVTGTGRP